jgi:hypothetical protein
MLLQYFYGIVRLIVFSRLLINAVLNLVGLLSTMGAHAGIKKKLDVYAKLIAWHLEGCPDDK